MIILQFSSLQSFGQRTEFSWARSSGDTKADFGISIAADRSGNIFSTGYFNGTVDFDPGPDVSSYTAGIYGSAFLTKWDSKGNFLWTKMLAKGAQQSNGMSLAIDANGNVYVTGSFGGTSDFDPGTGEFKMSTSDSTDIYISKLDNNGNFIWARQFVGNQPNHVRQLKLDRTGNAYVTGVFEGTIDFDPGPGTFNISNPDGASFLTKLDPTGNFVWAKTYFIIFSFDIDQADKIIIAGQGITVQKMDTDAKTIWSRSFGGAGTNFVSSIAADANGKLYLTGRYTGDADLDPGPEVKIFKDPDNDGEVFISKLDPDGNFLWGKQLGLNWHTPFFDPASLSVDRSDNPVMTGDFTGIVDFDPGTCEYKLDASKGYMYVLKMDNSGNIDWVKQIGGELGEARPSSILVTMDNEIYTTGWYKKTVDMDPGPAEKLFTYKDTVPSFGGDIFVMKMGPRPACKSSTADVYVCGSFSVGCKTYTTSGTYVERFELPGDCDSVVTINLTVDRVLKDTSITACKSYYWVDTLITESGYHSKLFRTPGGCDSLVKLHLFLKETADSSITKIICKGQSYLGYSNAGTYIDTFTAANGCDSVRTLNLIVMSAPKPDLGPDKTICEGEPIVLDAGMEGSYLWQDGSTGRTITVERPGNYQVQVTNMCGSGSNQLSLSNGICDVYFPNAFTPDRNGKNDQFKILTDIKLQYFDLIVFNRWGQKIYESREPTRGWDGRVNGKEQPSGSYVWKCIYRTYKDSSNRIRSGTLTLIR